MRSLAPSWCAVLALIGCSSTPIDGPTEEPSGEPGSVTGTPNPRTPPLASAGNFRPIPAYPAGPYGSQLGAIIADHTFLGWRDPVAAGFDASRLEEVRLSDYYDPRGAQTELIVVNASAVWCPACRSEMTEIDQRELAARYRSSKVVLFGTLFEDVAGRPATPNDLTLWSNQLGFVVEFPLTLDPGLKLGPYFADAATPLNLIIDARTMEILQAYMGYGETLWTAVDRELTRRGVAPPAR
jgi:hypothetical protein